MVNNNINPIDELTSGSISWDDNQDATRLCKLLIDLSTVDQQSLWGDDYWVDQEKIRGIALFLRAGLPYDAAKPKEALKQLLDLTYSGNNRAYFALLCASLPFDDVKRQIADFCCERLKAGSGHGWERVFTQMPASITEPYFRILLNSSNLDSLSRILNSYEENQDNIPDSLWQEIIELAMTGDDKIRRPACQLAVTQPMDLLQGKQNIINSYLDEWYKDLEPVYVGVYDFNTLVSLHSKCDDNFKARYEELLLGCIKCEPNSQDKNKIAACAKALARTRSALLKKLLQEIGDNGYFEIIKKTAASLQMTVRSDEDKKWLEELFLQLPYQTCIGTAILGSLLGYPECIDLTWKYAKIEEDNVLALNFLSSLAFGGNSESIYILSQLEHSLNESIIKCEGNVNQEPLRSWSEMQTDLLGSVIDWAYQSAESISMRWKVLLEVLRIGKKNYHSTQGVLIAMVKLCRNNQFPINMTYNISANEYEWIDRFLPFDIVSDQVPRIAAGAGGTSYWLSELCSETLGFLSSKALMAPMDGKAPPLDNDQQMALDEYTRRRNKVLEIFNNGKIRETTLLLAPMLDLFQRVPLRGKEREIKRCELEFQLAWCYQGIFSNEEKITQAISELDKKIFSDIKDDMHVSQLEEGVRRFFLHSARALKAALSINSNVGIARIAEMYELQSNNELLTMFESIFGGKLKFEQDKPELASKIADINNIIKHVYKLLTTNKTSEAITMLLNYIGSKDQPTLGENLCYKYDISLEIEKNEPTPSIEPVLVPKIEEIRDEEADWRELLNIMNTTGNVNDAAKLLKIYPSWVNVTYGEKRFSLLTTAAFKGYFDIVKLLIGLGADINACDGDGDTAFDNAVLGNKWEIAEYLHSFDGIKGKNGYFNAYDSHKSEIEEKKRPPVAVIESGTSTTSDRKLIAGILGILFGAFGIHRFYLGYSLIGVIQIVVTLITSGWGALWGIVEGILILNDQFITKDSSDKPL